MKVSVAICTYNGARYLEPQLESILGQTRPPDEIVLRDDGSTDGTLELAGSILRGFAGRVDLRRNEQRLGVARNFEGALRACSGDAIFLSDQDDVWMPDKVDVMAGIFEARPDVSWLFSDGDCIDGSGKRIEGRLWKAFGFGPRTIESFRSGDALDELLKAPRITGATMALRARAAWRTLPIREGWVHDHWMSLLLASLDERAVAIGSPLISYRIHSGQQIGTRATGLGWRMRASRASGREAYEREAGELRHLLEAARGSAAKAGAELAERQERRIESKIRHFQARARMREVFFPVGLALALRELAAGRYRYSFSRYAFLKDAAGL